MKNTDVIPKGFYCYSIVDGEHDTCPYWDTSEDHRPQDNGYCHFLGEGDWDVEGLSLLWDQCKECGENLGEEGFVGEF